MNSLTRGILAVVAAVLLMIVSPPPTRAGAPSEGAFTHIATYRGLALVGKTLIGPGPKPGSERIYQSYVYSGGKFDVVSVDPDSGAHQVFETPVPSEGGAYAMVTGDDGNIYVGTLPTAHVMRINPGTGEFSDLGRPIITEQYIWGLALGADKKIYGCTFPSAKLFRLDPGSGRIEDLGRMDPTEQYGRYIAASDDGFVYVGTGPSKAHVVAYEIATGRFRDILPSQHQVRGFVTLFPGEDGKVYGMIGGQNLRFEGWEGTPIPATDMKRRPENRFRDKRLLVHIGDGHIRVREPKGNSEGRFPFRYEGKEMDIFRLGLGPDGKIYGSTILPLNFFSANPTNGKIEDLGQLGNGEFYSFLRHGKFLLGAAYTALAPLMVYDPSKQWNPAKEGGNANPLLVSYEGQDSGWRPLAMVAGPDEKVFVGAVAGYTKLGGPLTMWDLKTNKVESFHHVVKDQSVVSIAVMGTLVMGGTSIGGGGGSTPTQTEGKIFLWDPQTKQKVFETVPVPKAITINTLVVGPSGRVYGVAGNNTLFVFDVASRKVIHTAAIPVQSVIYSGMALGSDGQIWGVGADGIFTIDPRTNATRLVARTPERATAGFGWDGQRLYYASGAKLYRYELPGR